MSLAVVLPQAESVIGPTIWKELPELMPTFGINTVIDSIGCNSL
jgi:hypothetical protein